MVYWNEFGCLSHLGIGREFWFEKSSAQGPASGKDGGILGERHQVQHDRADFGGPGPGQRNIGGRFWHADVPLKEIQHNRRNRRGLRTILRVEKSLDAHRGRERFKHSWKTWFNASLKCKSRTKGLDGASHGEALSSFAWSRVEKKMRSVESCCLRRMNTR